MPELPDVVVYLERLRPRTAGRILRRIRIAGPSLLRTVDPPVEEAEGKRIEGLRRVGKRIVFELERKLFLVLHLMIAGRLHWKPSGTKVAARGGLAAFDVEGGTLLLTEAGSRKRASLHLVLGEDALLALDPGGLEAVEATTEAFREALLRENRTLKRALTDPRLISGIGNAYSDEILHAARLSPLAMTGRLSGEELTRLHEALRRTLGEATERLRAEAGDGFPEGVTAFRPWMAVHGRFGKPCPDCGAPVQRIRYADTETNYCARCQTGGKVLADRSLSRLLRDDWPRTIDEVC